MSLKKNKEKKEKPTYKVDWATYESVKYACLNWHYSKAIPAGKMVKIGIWEDEKFVGVIVYSYGACSNLPKLFNMKQSEVCELTRIAMKKHYYPVTKYMAISRKMLKKFCPDIKMIVSYADMNQGHKGSIYKADNWKVYGKLVMDEMYMLKGKTIHSRSVGAKYGTRSIKWLKENVDKNVKKIDTKGKIRYIYDLRR
jgi:hypothetical protein